MLRNGLRWAVGWCLCLLVLLAAPTVHAGIISESQEIQMGKDVDKEVMSQYGLVDDQALQDEVTQIGKVIAAVSPRPKLPWTFKVIKDPNVNAFSTLGGYVYINKGMMDFAATPDELAFVIGHETGHIVERHVVKSMEKDFWTQLLVGVLVRDATVANNVYTVLSIAQSRGFGFKAEHQADEVGIDLMYKAGYNPYGAVVSMERMRDKFGDGGPSDLANWIKPHPNFDTRIADLNKYIAQLHYKAVPKALPDGAAVYIGDIPVFTYTRDQGKLKPWYQAELAAGELGRFLAAGGCGTQLWTRDAADGSGDVEIVGGDRVITRVTVAEAAAQNTTAATLAASFISHVSQAA